MTKTSTFNISRKSLFQESSKNSLTPQKHVVLQYNSFSRKNVSFVMKYFKFFMFLNIALIIDFERILLLNEYVWKENYRYFSLFHFYQSN
jgi:hypothetical protein